MEHSRLTDLLGIQTPIVLGPFGGMSSIELTATVSNLGGLGSYGLSGYAAPRITDTIAALRDATQSPFAVNLWIPVGDEVTPGDVDIGPTLEALRPLFELAGVALPEAPEQFAPTFEEQIEAVLAAAPPVISFVFGTPPADVIERAHAAGTRIIATVTTVEEAVVVAEAGVDAIVATGLEAGGHRVSFLKPATESLVGTFALIPQVVDAVDVPVIAAGAVADARGVVAAFALGAEGVQVGSAFLRTRQSAASDAHRAALTNAGASDTILTSAMSGRYSRGLRNHAVTHIEAGNQIAPFPAQNWMTGQFRATANRLGIGELQSLWAGQSAGLAIHDDAADLFAALCGGIPDATDQRN